MTDKSTGNYLPILDFSCFPPSAINDSFIDNEETAKLIEQLLFAVKEYGFFYVNNHGIPQNDIDAMFKLSARFFASETRYEPEYAYEGSTNVGLSRIGKEILNVNEFNKSESDKPTLGDYKETFNMYGKWVDRENKQKIPEILLEEKALIDRFSNAIHNLVIRILKVLGLALKLSDPDFFVTSHSFEKPTPEILRLLYYPKVPSEGEVEVTSRAGGHTDYGSITLLFQEKVGGLEALFRSKDTGTLEWTPVPPIPGAIIVNSGDLMNYWTGGFVKSAIHRVTGNYDEERYSIAYFQHPWMDTKLEPLDSDLLKKWNAEDRGEEKVQMQEEFSGTEKRSGEILTAYEHLMMRLRKSYT